MSLAVTVAEAGQGLVSQEQQVLQVHLAPIQLFHIALHLLLVQPEVLAQGQEAQLTSVAPLVLARLVGLAALEEQEERRPTVPLGLQAQGQMAAEARAQQELL
jgi:hypothetical protein